MHWGGQYITTVAVGGGANNGRSGLKAVHVSANLTCLDLLNARKKGLGYLYFPLSYFVLVPQSNRLIDTFIIGELTRTLFPKILLYLCSPSKVELLTFTSKS